MSKEEKALTHTDESPNRLIELAIEKQAPIENLDKLMTLQERWEKNQARKAFFQAKSDFQKNKPVIKKSEKVEYKQTRYFFAPLSEIQKAVDPVLAEHGLSYDWKQEEKNDQITITCVLSHELGHSEETSLKAPHDNSGNKNSIQSIGSTVSYLKRYTLENALGLSGDKDDDGQGAPSLEQVKIMKLRDQLMTLYMDNIEILKKKLSESRMDKLKSIVNNREAEKYAAAIKSIKEIIRK